MAKASELMTKEPGAKRASESIIGGLGGVIPTKDLPAAHSAYQEYAIDYNGPEEQRMPFEEWVRTSWKK
jgi:hypothetical protein